MYLPTNNCCVNKKILSCLFECVSGEKRPREEEFQGLQKIKAFAVLHAESGHRNAEF